MHTSTTLNLPEPTETVSNRPFKSTGENSVMMNAGGQMTDTKMIFHAVAQQTNRSCLITEIHASPNDASLHHMHGLEDEGFYVIEGGITLHSREGDMHLGPGEFGWAPRNHQHGYTIGPDGARILLIQTPGTELTEAFKNLSNLPQITTQEEFEELQEWSLENYGLTWFSPFEFPPGSLVEGES